MTTRTFIIFPIFVAGAAWLLYSEALLAAVVFNMTRFIPSLLESGYHVNGQNIVIFSHHLFSLPKIYVVGVAAFTYCSHE